MDEFNFSSLVLTHALDRRIFMAWLCGASVDEALAAQKLPPYEWPSSAAKKQILSQYRQFEMMEHFLHRPQYFVGPHQFVFPVSLAVKRSLIEMYYQFDHPVVRELLGKKLGSRSRKDLEEICVKTKVSIGSCRRQFDNMKRVMKRTEDLEGSLLLNIRQLFQISPELASKYAHVIFISNYRLEISKKRLAHYNFEDIEYCAAVFIRYWCTGANGEKEEFDPQLAQDIREIKSAVNGSKDFMDSLRSIVTQRLSTELPSSTTLNPTSAINRGATFSFKGFSALINSTNATSSIIDLSSAATPTNTVATPTSATAVGQPSITANFNSQFKQLVRTTISLGCGLSQPKEIRDLIIDIVEKIVEPCASFGWRKTEIDCFFDAINGGWTEVGALPQEFIELKRPSWDRLTAGIRLITLRLSNDLSAALAL